MIKHNIAFSKFMAYGVGGAEKSLIEKLKLTGDPVKLVSFLNVESYGAKEKLVSIPEGWSLDWLDNVYDFSRFGRCEYFLNKKLVAEYFSTADKSAHLHCYSNYAPVAANSFRGEKTIYIRSENDIFLVKNYESGLPRLLKSFYIFTQKPVLNIYRAELLRALSNSKVVANSVFIQQRLFDEYRIDSIVEYPIVDEQRLRYEYAQTKNVCNEPGIVFVGEGVQKGEHIARALANSFSSHKFYFFQRNRTEQLVEGNITYMPWCEKEAIIYHHAKVVIVPSIWSEAFGRVAREACLLNIPVLASKVGGLPEAVSNSSDSLVSNYKSEGEWKKSLNEILSNADF